MLTPRFTINQTEEDITLIVHAPHANIKDTEVYVDGKDFRFYSSPYYLRLSLPGEIIENDDSKGDYDCDKGDFTLKFSKINKGEYFENLDMMTSLLAPSKKKSHFKVPTIEVISNPCVEDENDLDSGGDEWHIEQKIPESEVLLHAPKYGFANKVSGALGTFETGFLKDIIDLPDPDKTSVEDRKILRENHENSSFDEGHYLADYAEVDQLEGYLIYKAEWESLEKSEICFNDAEQDLLKELPNKEYLMSEDEVKMALLSMVDILYASCYDHRTTCGESTVESGWTINKLSSTLCWFQTFTEVQDVINSCLKRSLCYPLVRNWELGLKVLEDVKQVLKLGKKYVIKRFCEIHHIFNTSHEPRYILNQLYVEDYIIWLQKIPDCKVEEVYSLTENISPKKDHMKIDILELEAAADSVKQDNLVIENGIEDITEYLNKTSLNIEVPRGKRSDFTDSGSSSTDSTTSSSSDSSSDSSSTSSSSESSSESILDSDDEPNK